MMGERSGHRHPPNDASTGGTPPALADPMDAPTRQALVARRLDVVRAHTQAHGGGSWFTTDRANVAWLTAGGQHHVVHAATTGVAGILVTPSGGWLVTPTIERARLVEEEFDGLGLDVEAVPWYDPDGVAGAARRLAGTELLDDAALEAVLVRERSVLDDIDIERLARLGGVARWAVETTLAAATPGTTEDELAASLLGRLVGVRAPVVLVAADERIAQYRHPLPTARPIRDRVMLVLVAEAWGLHVALTRFATFRSTEDATDQADADLEHRWRVVRDVQRAMTEATIEGRTLGDVLRSAQDAYASGGFPEEWRDHHQGGTIAYHGRERVAVPEDGTAIEAGMAFAWNPSIAGVKVEDTFVLERDGSRRWITGEP
jgi:Xaa-Pro dipeptidase